MPAARAAAWGGASSTATCANRESTIRPFARVEYHAPRAPTSRPTRRYERRWEDARRYPLIHCTSLAEPLEAPRNREVAMNLEYEFSYRASLKPALAVGPGPYGMRLVVEVTGGSFEGKRPKGKILTGGADWLFAGAAGFGRLDVRAQLVTEDGAAIYLSYFGILEMNAKIQQALSDPNSGTDFGDQYFRTSPRFEP